MLEDMSTLYTEKIPGTKFAIAGSGGSVENSRRFAAGDADFGPIYSSNLYDIYNGTGSAKGRKPTDDASLAFNTKSMIKKTCGHDGFLSWL